MAKVYKRRDPAGKWSDMLFERAVRGTPPGAPVPPAPPMNPVVIPPPLPGGPVPIPQGMQPGYAQGTGAAAGGAGVAGLVGSLAPWLAGAGAFLYPQTLNAGEDELLATLFAENASKEPTPLDPDLARVISAQERRLAQPAPRATPSPTGKKVFKKRVTLPLPTTSEDALEERVNQREALRGGARRKDAVEDRLRMRQEVRQPQEEPLSVEDLRRISERLLERELVR